MGLGVRVGNGHGGSVYAGEFHARGPVCLSILLQKPTVRGFQDGPKVPCVFFSSAPWPVPSVHWIHVDVFGPLSDAVCRIGHQGNPQQVEKIFPRFPPPILPTIANKWPMQPGGQCTGKLPGWHFLGLCAVCLGFACCLQLSTQR